MVPRDGAHARSLGVKRRATRNGVRRPIGLKASFEFGPDGADA